MAVRWGPRVFDPEIWSENVDEAVRCLSAASFGLRDVFAANLAIATYGANVGAAFFGRSKMVTAARHEQLLALRPSFDKLATNGCLRFAGTTSPPCPAGILSRRRARRITALRVDYALDPRFSTMTAVEGGKSGLWGQAPGESALATAKYVHASFN